MVVIKYKSFIKVSNHKYRNLFEYNKFVNIAMNFDSPLLTGYII